MDIDPTIVLALLLCASAASPVMAQEAAVDGERLFRARCASCHSVESGQNRIGPSLAGIVGRAAASIPGARYSEALRASGRVWDPQSLNAYLDNPRRTVPGTSMTVAVPNTEQRTAIIAYLRGLAEAN